MRSLTAFVRNTCTSARVRSVLVSQSCGSITPVLIEVENRKNKQTIKKKKKMFFLIKCFIGFNIFFPSLYENGLFYLRYYIICVLIINELLIL